MKLNQMQGFMHQYKRIIYTVYMLIRHQFQHKLGRKYKVKLTEQISLTLFKLKYNLPDRLLEDLFQIDHVTISRIINRISLYLSQLKFNTMDKSKFYIVDSTILRIGKDKNNQTYSGYKHHHGVKFQVVINDQQLIKHVSQSHAGSIHDKKLFLQEYKNLRYKLDKNLKILGDKAYVGLSAYHVEVPVKRNEVKYKQNKLPSKIGNKSLSQKRIKIEHVFAYLKNHRILQRLNDYKISKIEVFFNAIANIYNLTRM